MGRSRRVCLFQWPIRRLAFPAETREPECWMRYSVRRIFSIAVLMGLFPGLGAGRAGDIPQTGYYQRDGLEPKIEAAIEEFRACVPTLMGEGDIPGARAGPG